MIEFTNVSKGFRRSQSRLLLRDYVQKLVQPNRKKDYFWALTDVSFHLKKGESLAVIGPNGAGKSTLLSLVAGLAQPDGGKIHIEGRVAGLLELGSGFHPDLTGSENVRLNAALLGFSRLQTEKMYDEIVEFSGIRDFINEPLRTYSTGMVMRLAFSTAINLDPDVILIDEVLAVGDQEFQARCIDKIHAFRAAGKTIFAVSHAVGTVQQLCDRAIWLDHGKVEMFGGIWKVTEAYSGVETANAQNA